MSSRKVAKRACDGCKIRKVKCTEVSPCEGCISAGIACTFERRPHTRGPRRLRNSTLQEIKQTQQQWEARSQQQWADSGLVAAVPPRSAEESTLTQDSVFAPSKVASLVLQLCVYRLRVYPIWPIIKVERLVASLQRPEPDVEVFALAFAVAAATISQIKAKPSSQPGIVTAEMMEAQCQYAKARQPSGAPPNVTTVRIAFFLHIYYENQEPGCLQSILYLREAIAIAQIVGLHRESYYTNVQPGEQQIRRRTFWLLFVTER
jgi:Fungal specific transcription factor domain/Fungal Zn(2)-Cys(6) binuclear cluster domain